MTKIVFATTNQRKIDEAKLACEPLGIEIIPRAFAIDEIQSHTPIAVAEHKAREAYRLAGEPVVVTDTNWSIPALNGFPGAYMKDVAEWFSEQDFVNLLSDKDDKSISFTENIAYYDGTELKTFSKEFFGEIVEPRGTGNSVENVAQFNGKTLGENRNEGGVSHKAEDYIWVEFARWFSAK